MAVVNYYPTSTHADRRVALCAAAIDTALHQARYGYADHLTWAERDAREALYSRTLHRTSHPALVAWLRAQSDNCCPF